MNPFGQLVPIKFLKRVYYKTLLNLLRKILEKFLKQINLPKFYMEALLIIKVLLYYLLLVK